jgi:hypothetical protein
LLFCRELTRTEAVLKMKKLDIDELKRAAAGCGTV